jgi:hypothetical protein
MRTLNKSVLPKKSSINQRVKNLVDRIGFENAERIPHIHFFHLYESTYGYNQAIFSTVSRALRKATEKKKEVC